MSLNRKQIVSPIAVVFALLVVLCAFRSVAQGQNQAKTWRRFPVRYIQQRTYNLAPLITWWDMPIRLNQTTNDEPRPLPAWSRVLGGTFRPHALGWVVDGQIEDAPGHVRPATFLLMHPPVADRERFYALHAQLNDMQQAARSANFSAMGAQNIADEDATDAHINGLHAAASPSSGARAAADKNYADEKSALRFRNNYMTQANNAIASISQINDALSVYPSGNDYHLDLFAVKRGYLTGTHTEVYDLGVFLGIGGN